jgi:hypothetical protein
MIKAVFAHDEEMAGVPAGRSILHAAEVGHPRLVEKPAIDPGTTPTHAHHVAGQPHSHYPFDQLRTTCRWIHYLEVAPVRGLKAIGDLCSVSWRERLAR